MAITKAVPDSLLLDLYQGVMDFQLAGDTFKIALYSTTASLGTGTTAYTTSGEVTGTNYTAGGATLTSVDPVVTSNVAVMDWADASWTTATISNVGGAMIYNSSQSNAAVAILKFDPAVSPSAQTLSIAFPAAASTTAILRIKQKV